MPDMTECALCGEIVAEYVLGYHKCPGNYWELDCMSVQDWNSELLKLRNRLAEYEAAHRKS
jgi:hypothetical protein